MLIYLIVLGVLLFILALIAKKFEKIANQKGYGDEIHSFAMCFWFGIIGYLYVIALPDLTISRRNNQSVKSPSIDEFERVETKEDFKNVIYECPCCKENINYGIESCPTCGQRFDWKKVD